MHKESDADMRVNGGWRARWALLLCALCCLVVGLPAHAAGLNASAGRGYVDQVQVLGRQMQVSGWAGSEQPQVFVTNVIVHVAGREVFRGRMQRAERPDVAEATGRADWRGSGFSVRFTLPSDLPAGPQPLAVDMRLGDGREFRLGTDEAQQRVEIAPWHGPSLRARIALGLALGLPLLALIGGRALPARWRGAPWPLAGALGLSFVLLVGTGVTGSSLPLLLGPPAVTEGEAATWWGAPRVVRSDEWQVITPLALAQAAHAPRFPVLNRNLGQDGQNMLVIGMTGVPVAHASALAKPATWGFFAFDLRRALAWAWWLPWFGGFAACWALLVRLTGLGWRPAAALAACLALAPYSVAFSGWPAYLLMFAALGLLALDRLLHAARAGAALGWGALLGWSAAGYALVLYPAWQISVATLCGPLALAWAWRQRAHWRWGWAQTLGAALALALPAALLWAWWADVREAVAVMRATVYPGQRASEGGGDIDRWFLLKGWLNPVTMHADAPMVRSEAASFLFLWLGTLAALALAWWRARRVDVVPLALLAFAAFALTYQFAGLPAPVLQASLWRLVTSYRLDLALGLAQVLLLGWLLARPGDAAAAPATRWAAGLAALAALGLAAWEVSRMPLDIAEPLPQGFVLLCALAVAAAAALLVLGRGAALLALYGGWTLAAVATFHPLVRAPDRLDVLPALRAAGMRTGPEAPRVAVLGERNWAMTLPAAGVPVVSSVFYYPQFSLWRALDPQGAQRGVYNRYQRLMLELAPLDEAQPYRIESPRLDEVRVTLDPQRFDFRLLGAQLVLAPAASAKALQGNATLEPAAETDAYVLLRVRP